MQQIGAQQSPQGLAALAMGNPAPLQQRVARGGKDPQTGLPKDLVAALALSITQNSRNQAEQFKAEQQLQQAAGPTGQMPTVVESLQQQAQQKMQAQAMQAQRQQQGLQALAQRAPNGPVPAGTPQPEAQPEAPGIDQLPAEFGMAGGGLVAFNGTSGSEVPLASTDSVVKKVLQEKGYTPQQYIYDDAIKAEVDAAARASRGVARSVPAAAVAEGAAPAATGQGAAYGAGKATGSAMRAAAPVLKKAAGPVAAGGVAAAEGLSDISDAQGFYDDPNVPTLEKAKQWSRTAANVGLPMAGGAIGAGLTSWMGGVPGAVGGAAAGAGLAALVDDKGDALKEWEKKNPKKKVTPINIAEAEARESGASTRRLLNDADAASRSAPVARPPVPGPRPAAAPGAGNMAAPGAGSAPRETMDPMEKAIRDNIMSTMGRKDEDEYKQGVERFQKTTGLDALYKEMGDRATAREARNAEAQSKRSPEWVKGLASLGGAPVRGGLGMLLAKAGAGAGAAREAYGAEDAKFANEIDQLRDNITKAKMEGNMKAAAAGEQALKDLIANKRAAEQSGTSLLNTQEQSRTRKQIAADSAASRAQVAQARQDQLNQASDLKKLSAAESAFDRDPEVKVLVKRFEDPLFVQSPEGQRAISTLRRIQQDKYRQFGVTTADTGAKDTGFTSAPTANVRPALK